MTPNDSLIELLTMIDAAQGASAHRIIAVMPWYGYARQDKKSAPREPISARIVAKCLEGVGVDRVLTMDLHAGQVQGFFHVPVDHMTAMPMLTQWFADQHLAEDLVIVSPDAGRVKTARNFARRIGTHWAVMEKERPAQQVAEIGYVVGDVKGKTAVLVDDMIDTAGTLCAAAQTVLDEGAARVIACATHGVFSGPAYERLAYENSGDRADRRQRHDPAAPRRPRQHHRALDRRHLRRLDPPHLHRRLGLRDLRRREPALLRIARQRGLSMRERTKLGLWICLPLLAWVAVWIAALSMPASDCGGYGTDSRRRGSAADRPRRCGIACRGGGARCGGCVDLGRANAFSAGRDLTIGGGRGRPSGPRGRCSATAGPRSRSLPVTGLLLTGLALLLLLVAWAAGVRVNQVGLLLPLYLLGAALFAYPLVGLLGLLVSSGIGC